jgi:MoaA/NifB/PqqE/SkfB family radical SAM enzyme
MAIRATLLDRIRMGFAYLPYFSLSGMKYFHSWLRNERVHKFDEKLRINSFIPPWPSIPHDRLLHAAFSDDRIPFQVYYAITGMCPCSCDHCSYAKRTETELDPKEGLELIQQIKNLGCSLMGFTGGEPLLRKDLEVMISACKPEMATIVFTTGHGLTLNRAKRLKKAGLDWFTVGFESANERTHDCVRHHPGSFKKAVNALEIAHEAELYTAISIVASKSKIKTEEIEQIFEFAEDYHVDELRVIPYVATGDGLGNTDEMLGPTEYKYLTRFHKAMNKSRSGPVVESFSYIESAELFGCGAGYHHFFIDANGNVCPCDLTPISFGSVKDELLNDIWGRMNDYFSQPRTYCIMERIAPKIGEKKSLPLSLSEADLLIPPIEEHEELPKMYRFLKRRNE